MRRVAAVQRLATPRFNGAGNQGYGAYGENVGIGNLDDDPQQEVVVTFDNHQINVFNHDGTSVLASPWYTNRQNAHAGRRLGWGQFIRWLSPRVEDDHYHRHVGDWPDINKTLVAAVDRLAAVDRRPRPGRPQRGDRAAERREARAVRDAGLRVHGARRRVRLRQPIGAKAQGLPQAAADPQAGRPPDGDWYPPSGIPAPTIVNLRGSRRPEIVASVPDGSVYAVGPGGKRLWRYDYARGAPKTFASEVVAADLNRDGRTELVFGTYALAARSGRLVVLSASGKKLHDIRLRNQGSNGNGIGVPAAPSIGDLDGDGRLEIVLSTFDHGIDVYRVPRSGTNRMPWPTGRGNLRRSGAR